jgi:transcriptional regulator with XRE-family HTH domain
MIDFTFSKPDEIVARLCERLRLMRIAQQMTQAELAGRAGVSVNTVSNMEAGRNIAFESVVRIAMVLGRGKELEELFKPQLTTLEDLRRYEESTTRQRIKKRNGHA